MASLKEMIAYAAVQITFKVGSVVYVGEERERHSDIFARIGQISTLDVENITQGFWTTKERFVEREEAARIAFCAGQIKTKTSHLLSEDVW